MVHLLAHSSTKNKNKDILDQNLVATARKVRCCFHQDNNAYTQIYNMFYNILLKVWIADLWS